MTKIEKSQKIKRWTERSLVYISSLKVASSDLRQSRLLELRDSVVQYQFMVAMKKKYASKCVPSVYVYYPQQTKLEEGYCHHNQDPGAYAGW